MTTDSSTTKGISRSVTQSLTGYPESVKAKKKDEQVNGSDFFSMLVTQIDRQSSSDETSGDQFAVNLDAFNRIDMGSAGDSLSLAGYLGTKVKVKADGTEVKSGEAGTIGFMLDEEASDVTISFLDSDDNVVASYDAGAMDAGENAVDVNGLNIADGSYNVKVTSRGLDDVETETQAYQTGTVSGFIPGSDPKLLVGSREYSPNDIV